MIHSLTSGDHSQMRITLKLNIKNKNKDLFKIEIEYKNSIALEYYQSF